MNELKKAAVLCGYVLISVLMLEVMALEALAADNSEGWRTTFDLVMRWVNFLILAVVLIKLGRIPVKSFLQGKKQDIADGIKALETEKEELIGQIDKNRKQLENSKQRLADLKQKIIVQGEKNKQKIIDEAERESKIMLVSAKQKIDSRIMDARETLKSEIVDAAIAIAMEKLPEKVTEDVNQSLIDTFIAKAASQ